MLRQIWKGPERRAHRRLEAAVEVAVRVEMYGFEGARPFFATGITLNAGRGGVLATFDVPVTKGSVCNVYFRDADVRIEPSRVQGRVVRCEEHAAGFLVAIAFETPLTRLELAQSEAPASA